MRGEQSAGLHPLTVQALAQVRERSGQGDRAAQPPRLVELPVVPLVRAGVELPAVRRRARAAPPATGILACHHCGHREPAPERCEQCGSISVARHGAGTERVQHDLAAALDGEDDGRFPVLRLDADTVGAGRGRRRAAAPIRGGRVGRADRHADGRQGPRLPRRDAGRGARRRRDPAVSGLSRRGAHVRADRPARRAGRPRRRGARARADDRARGPRDRACLAPRQRRLSRGRAAAPRGAALPAVLAPDQDRMRRRGERLRRARPPS